jgi:hypothetical protein
VSSIIKPEGARYEIAIDGTPRTYRDFDTLARQTAALLKAAQPHSEITVRDLWTGKVTVIEGPLSI